MERIGFPLGLISTRYKTVISYLIFKLPLLINSFVHALEIVNMKMLAVLSHLHRVRTVQGQHRGSVSDQLVSDTAQEIRFWNQCQKEKERKKRN